MLTLLFPSLAPVPQNSDMATLTHIHTHNLAHTAKEGGMGRKGSWHQPAHECNLKDFTQQKGEKHTHKLKKERSTCPSPQSHSSSRHWLGPSTETQLSTPPLQQKLLQGLGLQFNRFPSALWLSIVVTGSGTLENRQSLRNTLEPGEEQKVVEKAAQTPSNDWAHPVHLWEENRNAQAQEREGETRLLLFFS